MKKLLSAALCVLLLLLIAGCSKKPVEEITTTGEPEQLTLQKASEPYSVRLYSPAESVKPGESFDVILNFSGIENFACADIAVSANGAELQSYKALNDEIEEMAQNSDGKFICGCYVATTLDIDNCDIYRITYKAAESLEPGDKLEFSVSVDSIQVGTDDSGDTLDTVTDKAVVSVLTLQADS